MSMLTAVERKAGAAELPAIGANTGRHQPAESRTPHSGSTCGESKFQTSARALPLFHHRDVHYRFTATAVGWPATDHGADGRPEHAGAGARARSTAEQSRGLAE